MPCLKPLAHAAATAVLIPLLTASGLFTYAQNAPAAGAAHSANLPPGAQPLPDDATRAVNQAMDDYLGGLSQNISGDVDDSGAERGIVDKEAISLVQQVYTRELLEYATRMRQMIAMPDADLDKLTHQLRAGADPINETYQRLVSADNSFNPFIEGGAYSKGAQKDKYEAMMRHADEADNQGDHQTANAIRAQANETYAQWVWYVKCRQEFYAALDKNPLLGVQVHGYIFNGDYLFQILQTKIEHTTSDAELRGLIREHLQASLDQTQAELDRVQALTTLAQLWELGGPRYARQQAEAAQLGGRAHDLIDSLQADHAASDINKAVDEGWKNLGIATLVAAVSLVPVVGPVAAAGIQVYHDGDELVVAYVHNLDVENSAGVLGYTQRINSAEALADAKFRALVSAAMFLPQVPGAVNDLKRLHIRVVDRINTATRARLIAEAKAAGTVAAAAGTAQKLAAIGSEEFNTLQGIAQRAAARTLTDADYQYLYARLSEDPNYFQNLPKRGYASDLAVNGATETGTVGALSADTAVALQQSLRGWQASLALSPELREFAAAVTANVPQEQLGALAMRLKADPQAMRSLKDAPDNVRIAFNTVERDVVYKAHDDAVIQYIRNNVTQDAHGNLMPWHDNPDVPIKVDDFRTPGGDPNSVNTDRDFRVVYRSANGDWIEIPRQYWAKFSAEEFAKVTGYSPEELYKIAAPDDIQAWKNWDPQQHGSVTVEQAMEEKWQELHQQLATDKGHPEASAEFTDQGNYGGSPIQVDANIQAVKRGEALLSDPQGFGMMYNEKADVYLRLKSALHPDGDKLEAMAQLKKGINTLSDVRDGYLKYYARVGQTPALPVVSSRFEEASKAILSLGPFDKTIPEAQIAAVEQKLRQLGYGSSTGGDALRGYIQELQGQFEALQMAPPPTPVPGANPIPAGAGAAASGAQNLNQAAAAGQALQQNAPSPTPPQPANPTANPAQPDHYFNPKTGETTLVYPGGTPPSGWKKMQPIPPESWPPGAFVSYLPGQEPRLFIDPDTGKSTWVDPGTNPPGGYIPAGPFVWNPQQTGKPQQAPPNPVPPQAPPAPANPTPPGAPTPAPPAGNPQNPTPPPSPPGPGPNGAPAPAPPNAPPCAQAGEDCSKLQQAADDAYDALSSAADTLRDAVNHALQTGQAMNAAALALDAAKAAAKQPNDPAVAAAQNNLDQAKAEDSKAAQAQTDAQKKYDDASKKYDAAKKALDDCEERARARCNPPGQPQTGTPPTGTTPNGTPPNATPPTPPNGTLGTPPGATPQTPPAGTPPGTPGTPATPPGAPPAPGTPPTPGIPGTPTGPGLTCIKSANNCAQLGLIAAQKQIAALQAERDLENVADWQWQADMDDRSANFLFRQADSAFQLYSLYLKSNPTLAQQYFNENKSLIDQAHAKQAEAAALRTKAANAAGAAKAAAAAAEAAWKAYHACLALPPCPNNTGPTETGGGGAQQLGYTNCPAANEQIAEANFWLQEAARQQALAQQALMEHRMQDYAYLLEQVASDYASAQRHQDLAAYFLKDCYEKPAETPQTPAATPQPGNTPQSPAPTAPPQKPPAQTPPLKNTQVGMVIPADTRPGDTVTATVVTNPQRFANMPGVKVIEAEVPLATDDSGHVTLGGLVVDNDGHTPQRADQQVHLQLAQEGEQLVTNFLRSDTGSSAPVAQQITALATTPAETTTPTLASAQPTDYSTSPVYTSGSMQAIHGAFSGDSTKTQVLLDGKPVTILAEDNRNAYIATPTGMTPGAHTLTITESGKPVATFHPGFLSLKASADSLHLKRGQSTRVHVTILGADSIPESAWRSGVEKDNVDPALLSQMGVSADDLSAGKPGRIALTIQNRSRDVISMSGENNGRVTLLLGREQFPGGEHTVNLEVNAVNDGTFDISADAVPLLAPVAAGAAE